MAAGMTSADAAVIAEVLGDASSYLMMIGKLITDTEAASRMVTKSSDRMASNFMTSIDNMTNRMSGFLATMAASAGITTPFSFLKDSIKVFADTESALVQFTTMLGGNAQKARDLMQEMITFAAKTPLQLQGIQGSARQLLQVGVAAQDMIATLRMLGDVAGGDQARLDRLAYAFGQVKDMSRLTGMELLQFINAGFNPLQEMSRTTGKSMMQLRDEMSKGLITFDMVSKAFQTATAEGGRFHNGMENASQTLSGLWSTMIDDLQATQRQLGGMIAEQLHLKDTIRSVSAAFQEATKWFQELDNETKSIITYTALFALGVGTLGLVLKAGGMLIGMMATNLLTLGNAIKAVLLYLRSWISLSALATAGTNLLSVAWVAARVALTAIPWAAAVLGVAELTWYLAGGHEAMKAFNEEAKRARELDKELAGKTAKRDEAEISGAMGIEDPKKRAEELARLSEASEKEIAGKRAHLTAIKKELSEMSGISDAIVRSDWIPVIGRGEKLIFEGLTADAATAEAAIAAEAAKAAKLREELAKATEAAGKPDPAALKTLAELRDKYLEEAVTIDMSTEAKDLRRIASLKATEADKAAARSAIEMAMAAKAESEIRKEIAASVKAMKSDLATKEFEEQQKLFDKGADILRKYMTPQQHMEERVAELDKLLSSGIYSQEQYNFALGKVQEEFDETANAANKANSAIQQLDATLAGGAEAQRRITAYVDTLSASHAEKNRVAATPAPLLGAGGHNPAVVTALNLMVGLLGKIEAKPGLVVAPAEVGGT